MTKLQSAIRIILTLALLYGVYTETGPWTTLNLALMTVSHELTARRLLRLKGGPSRW